MAITGHKGRIIRAAPSRFPNQGRKLSDSTQQNLFELTDYDEFEVESRKKVATTIYCSFFPCGHNLLHTSEHIKSIYCGRRAPITPTSTSDCAGLLAHLNTAMDKVPSELLASSTRLRPGIPFRTPTNCIRSCRTDSDHRPPSSMGGKPYYAFEEHIITHPAPPS
jgi:hypothetical protein